ncbi:O-antigen ligase family protein [Geodermatophilus sp. URMC 61]|uniref:O-antigen ligase family protein n=1 Tax=Geodermatophilus sp. URMC 61 TaxID=3423411 RepID=UPI00406C0A36
MSPAALAEAAAAGGTAALVPGSAPRRRRPGWPLSALLLLYPLWWALGLGTLIVFVLAVPMAVHLWRRRPVLVPPGFGLWLLFLLWVATSTVMLGVNPPGTLPGAAYERVVSVAFNLAGYLVVAVALLYAGNLTEEEHPRARLVRELGFLFAVVVAGGLLGTFAPTFEFTSPVEWVLPRAAAENPFVQNLVHPTAAQLQQVLGYVSGRPAAPFGYTNIWGYVFTLLLGFFAVSWLARPGVRRLAGLAVLALGVVPVVYSLNRGVWIGLGVTVLVTVAWLARNGHLAGLVALLVGLAVAAVLVVASPLTGVVAGRLDNPHSDGIRAFTIERTLEVTEHSPVLGFGSTRRALGSSNSIAVGRNAECGNCGNATLGSTGQLWLLLIAQGVVGAALYVGFHLRVLWAFRRDRSAVGWAATLAVVLPLLYMFLYNALVVPLLVTFLGIALLWRNDQVRRAAGTPAPQAAGAARTEGGR